MFVKKSSFSSQRQTKKKNKIRRNLFHVFKGSFLFKRQTKKKKKTQGRWLQFVREKGSKRTKQENNDNDVVFMKKFPSPSRDRLIRLQKDDDIVFVKEVPSHPREQNRKATTTTLCF